MGHTTLSRSDIYITHNATLTTSSLVRDKSAFSQCSLKLLAISIKCDETNDQKQLD